MVILPLLYLLILDMTIVSDGVCEVISDPKTRASIFSKHFFNTLETGCP